MSVANHTNTVVVGLSLVIMASSNMRALWEARAEQDVAKNTRKQSSTEQPDIQHRPRLASNRRIRKPSKGASLESVGSLDDILLR